MDSPIFQNLFYQVKIKCKFTDLTSIYLELAFQNVNLSVKFYNIRANEFIIICAYFLATFIVINTAYNWDSVLMEAVAIKNCSSNLMNRDQGFQLSKALDSVFTKHGQRYRSNNNAIRRRG